MAAHTSPGYLPNLVIRTGGLPFYTPSTSSKKLLNNNTRDPERIWTSSEKYFSLFSARSIGFQSLGLEPTSLRPITPNSALELVFLSLWPHSFLEDLKVTSCSSHNSPASLSPPGPLLKLFFLCFKCTQQPACLQS